MKQYLNKVLKVANLKDLVFNGTKPGLLWGSRFAQTFGIARQYTPLPLLLGKEKIDNRSLNFVQNLGE